jgi:adenosine deaminase
MQRGVEFQEVIQGLADAITAHGPAGQPVQCVHKDRPFHARLIMCFLRDWKVNPADTRKPADPSFDGMPSAVCALNAARPYVDQITAVGLDNAEIFGEPALFEEVYAAAKEAGITNAVAHAGEEGTADPYVLDAVQRLKVQRLDHGVQTIKDDAVCALVRDAGLCLTVCPNSNDLLKVYDHFFDGRRDVVRKLIDKGLKVCLNSDDPAYFGGYMNVNFVKAAEDSQLTMQELVTLCSNAINATFAPIDEKEAMSRELAEFAQHNGIAFK